MVPQTPGFQWPLFKGRLFVLGALLLLIGCGDTGEPTVEALSAQLAGEHCRFDYSFDRGCEIRDEGFWQWLLREPHHCDYAAVQCLGKINTPQAHEALIGVLKTHSDVETCDGTWFVRTETVKALGESGYKPALEPLRRHLASGPVSTLSSGATGCPARAEPVEEIEKAIQALSR